MSNGAKLVVVLVLIFAGAGLYTALMAPAPKKPIDLAPAKPSDASTPRSGAPSAVPPSGDRSPAPPGSGTGIDRSREGGLVAPPPAQPERPAPAPPSDSTVPASPDGAGGAAAAKAASGDGSAGAGRSDGGAPGASVPGAGATTSGAADSANGAGASGTAPSPPRAAPAPPPLPSGPRDYSIMEGDTFTSIAEEYLGDARKWVLIARENPSIDPQRLSVGQKIRLPAQDAQLPAAPSAPPAPTETASSAPLPPGAVRYEVKQGDTLASIADRFYGTKAESAWKRIHEANRGSIGDDASRLKPGTALIIPPRS